MIQKETEERAIGLNRGGIVPLMRGKVAVTLLKMPAEAFPEPDLASVVENLEAARGRIEERFLDGGNAILAIMDVLNALVRSLDDLSTSLDAETAEQAAVELQTTGSRLSELTDLEASRQDSFRAILDAQQGLRPQVAMMQETLRYLRTFAVTAKITGAGVPEFAGFAEEILQRIADGRQQVDDLSHKLDQLGKGLGPVISRGASILQSYRGLIPAIVTELTNGGEGIAHHRKQLSAHAASVKAVTARIQTKLGSTLSAMQIGDATRQRIEHCQSAIAVMEEHLHSLSEEDQQSLATAVKQLVSLQLAQSSGDFARETKKIVSTVQSFHSDLGEIGTLRQLMSEGDDTGGGQVLRSLERAIDDARMAVQQVEAVAAEAAEISRGTAETVAELTQAIGMIQLVRTDIHYMALNTNLRCSRVGEDGKAINVVAAELRNFAAQLDATAETILVALQGLQQAADHLRSSQDEGADGSLDARLCGALTAIRQAAEKMDQGLLRLTAQSETAEEQTTMHLARLDFDNELGDILRSCADEMRAAPSTPIFVGGRDALAEVGDRILKLYTMAPERELHAKIFGSSSVSPQVAATTSADDDLMDALF